MGRGVVFDGHVTAGHEAMDHHGILGGWVCTGFGECGLGPLGKEFPFYYTVCNVIVYIDPITFPLPSAFYLPIDLFVPCPAAAFSVAFQ